MTASRSCVVVMLIAAGGPNVQILDVLNNNGVPFQEDYSLTCRGLL